MRRTAFIRRAFMFRLTHFYPEVLNPATHEKCADGETGELVFTTLAKEAMPF